MGLRTIVLFLTNEARAPAVTESTLALAAKHDAHVIGLYVIPAVEIHVAAEVPVTSDILSAQRAYYTEQADKIGALFEKAATAAGIAHEWRCVDSTGSSVAEAVMAHGRCADLIVCGQADKENDPASLQMAGEEVMMAGGRPVLMVPIAGHFTTIGENVLLAWNGSREAARAAFDALPILKKAKQVRILAVNPDATDLHGTNVPGSEIATALARHDVNCEAAHSVTSDLGVGDEILSRLADRGSDLLVMGGFGHSRFREYVFGGATRSILDHMTAPVLMSH
jgi:nucleotide-binding universal stress UspA family protein